MDIFTMKSSVLHQNERRTDRFYRSIVNPFKIWAGLAGYYSIWQFVSFTSFVWVSEITKYTYQLQKG